MQKYFFKLFPKNLNVAVTLSLFGLGPDKTNVTVIADPDVKMNCHKINLKKQRKFLIIAKDDTTPAIPSNLPPNGTVSRCEPIKTFFEDLLNDFFKNIIQH